MRVLFPFTNPHRPAVEALRAYAPQAEHVDVSASEWAYGQAIAERWGSEDLAIVEHDNEIHAAVMSEFESCPELWCVFPYRIEQLNLDLGLGCTRFRKEVMELVSWETVSAQYRLNCAYCPRGLCWRDIDLAVFYAMTDAGIERHVHSPEIKHHHNYGLGRVAHELPVVAWYQPPMQRRY